jgi:hypothetical protein
MTRYFTSFNDGDMQFPEEDFPIVRAETHEIMKAAIEAGVWIHGAGFMGYHPQVVSADGTVTEGPLEESNVHIGGFAIIDVETEAEAHEWARKFAISCRCKQEVRKIMDHPEQLRLIEEYRAR